MGTTMPRMFASLGFLLTAACSSATRDDLAALSSTERAADDAPSRAPDSGAFFCEEVGRFLVRGGVVLDEGSAGPIEWQRDVAPASLSHAEAVAFCNASLLDGAGWRLPTASELSSLVLNPLGLGASLSPVCVPSIDQVAFPATPPDDFWASETNPALDDATYTDFRDGRTHAGAPETPMSVRCVRTLLDSP
jgi:hypothetical protein